MYLAEKLKVPNLKFFPAIDKHLIPKALELSSAAVAAHEELPIYQYGLSMNKLNDYMASGKPTVFACNVANIVKDAGHFSIARDDVKKMSSIIKKIKNLSSDEIKTLSTQAKEIMRRDYNYTIIGKNYVHMLETL